MGYAIVKYMPAEEPQDKVIFMQKEYDLFPPSMCPEADESMGREKESTNVVEFLRNHTSNVSKLKIFYTGNSTYLLSKLQSDLS